MDPHDAYQNLLEKIADLGRRQDKAYDEHILCRSGCSHCCVPPETLFQVEAQQLEEGIARLDPKQQAATRERLDAYATGQRLFCPLLDQERCTVYEARPAICRTQGYALWFREPAPQDPITNNPQPPETISPNDNEGHFSWCALNFTEETPTKDLAFDVERLNAMLSLITQMAWPNQSPRRTLLEIIESGLTPREPLH